jgi:hypothetical protein
MIGAMAQAEQARFRAALSWPQTPDEVGACLGRAFRPVGNGPVDESQVWVHRPSLVLVEAVVEGDRLAGKATLIAGDDVRLYLMDWLSRLPDIDSAVTLLTQLCGRHPHVLEISKGGQRLLLPEILTVVELRARRRELERAQVMDTQASASALDAVLRTHSDAAAIQALLDGDFAEVQADPPLYLVLAGNALVTASRTGRFGLVWGDGLIERLQSIAPQSVAQMDAWLARLFSPVLRHETSDRRGAARVQWRAGPNQLLFERPMSEA